MPQIQSLYTFYVEICLLILRTEFSNIIFKNLDYTRRIFKNPSVLKYGVYVVRRRNTMRTSSGRVYETQLLYCLPRMTTFQEFSRECAKIYCRFRWFPSVSSSDTLIILMTFLKKGKIKRENNSSRSTMNVSDKIMVVVHKPDENIAHHK